MGGGGGNDRGEGKEKKRKGSYFESVKQLAGSRRGIRTNDFSGPCDKREEERKETEREREREKLLSSSARLNTQIVKTREAAQNWMDVRKKKDKLLTAIESTGRNNTDCYGILRNGYSS